MRILVGLDLTVNVFNRRAKTIRFSNTVRQKTRVTCLAVSTSNYRAQKLLNGRTTVRWNVFVRKTRPDSDWRRRGLTGSRPCSDMHTLAACGNQVRALMTGLVHLRHKSSCSRFGSHDLILGLRCCSQTQLLKFSLRVLLHRTGRLASLDKQKQQKNLLKNKNYDGKVLMDNKCDCG